jgi:hypothetical protein
MNSKTRFAAVLGILLFFVAIFLALHYSSSGGGLNRFKSELRAKGEKLTFAELVIPLSTNADEVACRELFATNNLIGDVSVPTLMQFAGHAKAEVTWRGLLLLSPSAGRTNPAASTWEELDRQNDALAPALGEFRHALEHPAPDTRWIYTNILAGPKVNWVRFRLVAQALVSDEIGALHRGNFEAARSDLHALAALPRMYRNDPSFVMAMIRTSIAEQGLQATWEALPAPGWDDKTLDALQRDWEAVDLLGGLERGLMGERAVGSAAMEMVRKSDARGFRNILNGGMTPRIAANGSRAFALRLRDDLERIAYKLTWIDADELFMLQSENQAVETARMLKDGRPWPEVHVAVTNLHAKLLNELGSAHGRRMIMSAMAIPNFLRAFEMTARTETMRRLAITAIAIQRYRLRYGKPPENLAALRPEFLSEVPIDPMSGKPLCYHSNADGSFALYSVGENGKDDGGSAGGDILWPAVSTN